MKSIRIGYYTEINLSDNDGPAVNECEFVKSLLCYDKENAFLFLTDANKNNSILADGNIFFLDKTPRLSEIHKWIKRFICIHRKIKVEKIELLVCRVPDFPIVLVLLKIINPNIKIAIKTAALWWMGRIKTGKILDVLYNFLNDTMTRWIYRRADAIDVAMLETKAELIRLGLADSAGTCLIDNNININMFYPISGLEARKKLNIPGQAIVLGFAGSLPSQRGAKQILELAEKLQNSRQNIYVLIVGNDINLLNLVRASSFPEERVILVGQIPYAEVPFYISAMTVCYSFFEKHKIKKTGNASQKVKQYIAMGKPVISVAVGHQYLIDNNLGSAVNQDNIEDIAVETIKWIKKIEVEGETLPWRLHQYAKDHLSTKQTFEQRLEFWNSLFKE